MSVIIDTSIWVEYFRNGNNQEKVDYLIDENLVATNDLILTELTPFLKIRKQTNLIDLLNTIIKLMIHINWDQLIDLHYLCLQNGLNGVGIPDLIIAQNALENDAKIYSLDKHFLSMADFLDIKIF
jgi:predicted nucleic acid-binding protein